MILSIPSLSTTQEWDQHEVMLVPLPRGPQGKTRGEEFMQDFEDEDVANIFREQGPTEQP